MEYILLFFIYSFLGWIIEVIYTLFYSKKIVNRGFLIGPICPIYGAGCILLILLLKRYRNDFFVLFLGSIFICSILEYVTSYVMEKLFKTRWWDYSHMKYNINGRICLETMLPFGFFGSLVVGYINPYLISLVINLNSLFFYIMICSLISILLVDIVFSLSIIISIKKSLIEVTGDSTEVIKNNIRNMFKNKPYIYRRVLTSFPNLSINKIRENIVKQIKDHIN